MDLIRVPDHRALQVMDAEQEMRAGLEAATYHPGLFLTQAQVLTRSLPPSFFK